MCESSPYDFTNIAPLPPEYRQRVARWLRGSCALLAEKWAVEMHLDVEPRYKGFHAERAARAVGDLPDPVVAYQVLLGDQQTLSLFALPRNIARTLVAGLLGHIPSEILADRELTPAEDSTCRYLAEMIFGAIRESWPGEDGLRLKVGEGERTLKGRWLLKPDTNVLVSHIGLGFGGELGETLCTWIAPQETLVQLFGKSDLAMRPKQSEAERHLIVDMIRKMTAELRVTLGSTQLDSAEIDELRPGDLVLLDQRVREPVRLSVAGEEHFLVWPGKVGPRQAVQIETIITE